MKRRLGIVTTLALVVGLLPVGAASADAPSGVYISLGTSLAAGTQANEAVTDDSYTDVLFQRLEDDLGLGSHVKLGCPGETSTTFLTGGCPGQAAVGPYPGGSQMSAALAAIAAAGPDLRLITIDLGANDVLSCLYDLQGQPTLEACLQFVALPAVAFNVTTIVWTLQAAAPGVPIVGMNYYNPLLAWVLDDDGAPFPGFGLYSQGLVSALDAILANAYGGFYGPIAPVPVADVATAFRTFDPDRNVKDVCRFTLMCERVDGDLVMSDWNLAVPGPQPDIHPTDIGYRQIAWAFTQTMEAAGII